MANIHAKTVQDLEFPTVLKQVSARCSTELGKERALEIGPIDDKASIVTILGQTAEYLSSFISENRIPPHGFDAINKELQLLRIENTTLEVGSFKKIATICTTVATQKKFLKKFKEYYPLLFEVSDKIELNTDIPKQIDLVIDRFGEVKDRASNKLFDIRRQMNQVKGKIGQSFASALNTYHGSDYLDDIRESVVENRRVLAVKAMYRRKVKGTVMGTSKTGSIVYIEPEATLKYSRELNNLEYDEKEEIQRILNELTDQIRPFGWLLAEYQDFLAHMDITAAKASYATDTNALLPEINNDKRLYLRDAFHPLLYLSNKLQHTETYPQTIELHPENRIIVISGPNAGGKSITLKTIGLLQVMLQSGLLIPVHERSSVCLFDTILTDIGDNQSIENHLSTYSYRLKNMKNFLRICDKETLFLIDEFGTGSDPELGGALAEAFLEVFYEREAYGVITTHYANLKALADELPHTTNANMVFNSKTLEPTFQLVLGEAGSSFTFEVAQKNGIPYSLINKAKKKIERGKVRFDATIAKLQKERSKMAKTGSRLQEEESKAREEAARLEKLNAKIKSKLENYQELYDHDQRMVQLGNKVDKAADRYFIDKKKRVLVSELLRIVETENSKRKKKTATQAKAERAKKAKVVQEVQKEVKVIREKKIVEKKKAIIKEKNKPRPVFTIGDRVRMQDGKSVGTIDSLEKNKAIVNYGIFTTNVSVDQLELIERTKK
ncbi:endonuclease MutS2 [Zobellia galactanivorans]|uniref:endonuclease MutS2 n=1 Tax=Zobellia galactanivorans (strain DSM 12802 / CCUG 47099 / CIP 106680 / NCIMB 13871 / Dsij) TaxID=63186 RepID=UPI001C07404E|nr:DNA mismatch repair protein MutS [Zobellia galactanivorans]MBU3024801.1 DNA mismatch repair protein MutS [Zobellia galactanivorans]